MCAYPKKLEVVAAHHTSPVPPPSWESHGRRHLIRIVPPVPGLWLCNVHAPCTCNEWVSATNRVLGAVPTPNDRGLTALKRELRFMSQRCGHKQPWSLERVRDSFRGPRLRRYQLAFDSLMLDPLVHADARIQSFVKAEKFDPHAKENPDPRMIQARSPRYNLVVAKYLRPVEHFIYNLCGKSGLREVAKGLNAQERASLLISKFQRFDDPVCIGLDASRWDKHVDLSVLQLEHGFYQSIFPNSPELQRILSWQCENKCRTSSGVKYTCVGGRMSGDVNTALGNCLLMVAMMRAACRGLGLSNYELLDDGDDCLVVVERGDVNKLDRLPQKFLDFGQELKLETVVDDVHDVEFCQSRVVFNGTRAVMVRDWRKVLSQACCGTKYWNDPNMVRPMLGLVGACELALNAGVPVLQSFALAMIRNSRGSRAKFPTLDSGLRARLQAEFGDPELALHSRAVVVTDESRAHFALTFGVPVWEQLAIEEILSNWTLTTTSAELVPTEWDSTWQDMSSIKIQLPQIY